MVLNFFLHSRDLSLSMLGDGIPMKLPTMYILEDYLNQACFTMFVEGRNSVAHHSCLQMPLTRFLLKVCGRYILSIAECGDSILYSSRWNIPFSFMFH